MRVDAESQTDKETREREITPSTRQWGSDYNSKVGSNVSMKPPRPPVSRAEVSRAEVIQVPIGSAARSGQQSGGTTGSLADGTYDESANAAEFQSAINEWRNGGKESGGKNSKSKKLSQALQFANNGSGDGPAVDFDAEDEESHPITMPSPRFINARTAERRAPPTKQQRKTSCKTMGGRGFRIPQRARSFIQENEAGLQNSATREEKR